MATAPALATGKVLVATPVRAPSPAPDPEAAGDLRAGETVRGPYGRRRRRATATTIAAAATAANTSRNQREVINRDTPGRVSRIGPCHGAY
ncbi:hypothetical protein GCM10010517_79380 [Streptosporangium fragile]|uniref:Uncharacterized protein n=1 Tax=Streptosporangium fragile TaxID=46186 RepID=A0ABN3WHD6_9ACTN